MKEGRGGLAGLGLPPLRRNFSTTCENLVHGEPHERPGSASPGPGCGPSAPSPLGDPRPAAPAGVPAAVSGQGQRAEPGPAGALPRLPFIQAGDPLGGGGRMGSVRSDHDGQRRAASPGCGDLPRSLCRRLVSASPAARTRSSWPASRPAACRAGGRRGRGTRGAGRRDRAALRRPGVGSPAVPPASGRGLGGDPGWQATCD